MAGGSTFKPFCRRGACPESMFNFVPAACNRTVVLTAGASIVSSWEMRQACSEGSSETSTEDDNFDDPLNGSRTRVPIDGRLHLGTEPFLLARRYSLMRDSKLEQYAEPTVVQGLEAKFYTPRKRFVTALTEDAISQYILAEDTFRAATPHVTIKITKQQFRALGQRESQMLRFLHSAATLCSAPGIVQLHGSFTFKGHHCIVLEELGGDLRVLAATAAHVPRPKAVGQLRSIAFQLVSSLAFIHHNNLAHSALSPDTVRIRKQGKGCNPEVVIADLSACRSTSPSLEAPALEPPVPLSLPYCAPEVTRGCEVSSASDCWSLACIMAELALHRQLFPSNSASELLSQVDQVMQTLPPPLRAAPTHERCCEPIPPSCLETASALYLELAQVDMRLADLVVALLDRDPSRRPSAAHALQHPFFEPVNPLQWLLRSLEAKAPAGMHSTITTGEEGIRKLGSRSAAAQLPRKSNSRGVKESSDASPLSATGRARTHSSGFQGVEGSNAWTLKLNSDPRLPQPGAMGIINHFIISNGSSGDRFRVDTCEVLSPPHNALLGRLNLLDASWQDLSTSLEHIASREERESADTDLVTGLEFAPSYLIGSTTRRRREVAVAAAAAVPLFGARGAGVAVEKRIGFSARASLIPEPVLSGAWERLGEFANQLMPWDESNGDELLTCSLAGKAGLTIGRRVLDPRYVTRAPSSARILHSPTMATLNTKRAATDTPATKDSTEAGSEDLPLHYQGAYEPPPSSPRPGKLPTNFHSRASPPTSSPPDVSARFYGCVRHLLPDFQPVTAHVAGMFKLRCSDLEAALLSSPIERMTQEGKNVAAGITPPPVSPSSNVVTAAVVVSEEKRGTKMEVATSGGDSHAKKGTAAKGANKGKRRLDPVVESGLKVVVSGSGGRSGSGAGRRVRRRSSSGKPWWVV